MKSPFPFIKLAPGVADAIRASAAYRCTPGPIQINLVFKGCCDSSLEMRMGARREGDLACSVDGICFLIQPKVFELSSEVTISLGTAGSVNPLFSLTSARQLSEWDGFGESEIQS